MRPRIVASQAKIKQLHGKVKLAKQNGNISVLRRAQALLGIFSGMAYEEIAAMVAVSVETIRLWLIEYINKGIISLKIKCAQGRPPKLSKEQKKRLKKAVKDGPEASGYNCGCWRSPLVQDFIFKTFGVFYSTFYIAQLLKNLGMSYQKARFTSGHLDPKKRKEWLEKTWPDILKKSKNKNTFLLFGDEVSFPQWGSLSYTWAPKGVQPTIQTSGARKGYKVFGLIDYWTGKFFYKATTDKFNSESYAGFLQEVISKTRKKIILIQDGARYHTSKAMMVFFYSQKTRLEVYQMPSYSPDYNPIELLWRKIKREGIHLRYFPTFESLMNKADELLMKFEDAAEEVLKVFGFYEKLEKA